MTKPFKVVIPVLTLFLLGAGPVVAENPYPSTQNEPTGEGNYRTDPGVGSDRIPGDGQAPGGEGTTFDTLDRNKDGNLDSTELNAYGSSAAGSEDIGGDSLGERNLKRLDEDQDANVSREEFEKALEIKREKGSNQNSAE